MVRRLNAQITVYAALSIFLVISLACTCIKSALVTANKAKMTAAASLSMESIFAGYSNQLLDEFSIFALKKNDNLKNNLNKMFRNNIYGKNSNKSDGDIEFLDSDIESMVMMTDKNGECLKKEILSYMQYGIVSELLDDYNEITGNTKQNEAVGKITDCILEWEDKLLEQQETVMKVIQNTEGIKTTSSGIEVYNGEAICIGEYFVKAVINDKLSKETAAIDNDNVYYAAQRNEYYRDYTFLGNEMYQCIDDIILDLDEIEKLDESQTDEIQDFNSEIEEYEIGYKNDYQLIKNSLSDVKDKISECLGLCAKYNEQETSVNEKYEECLQLINQKKDDIGNELYEAFKKDAEELKKEHENDKNSICNMENLKTAFKNKELFFSELDPIIDRLDLDMENADYSTLKDYIENFLTTVNGLSNSELIFDYSGIDFSEKKEGTGKIKKLYDQLKEGMMGLVIDSDNISDKEFIYDNSALQYSGSGARLYFSDNIVGDIKDNFLYNEYLFGKFSSYTDYISDDGYKKDTEKKLDYMLEYILVGEDSDKKNLSTVVNKLMLLREGVNMAYLIMDSQKRIQAEELALTLVGYTGNYLVLKAAQYLIMSVWALGESITELRKLYKGEKTEVFKTSKNWNLSLENLLKMNFDTDEEKQIQKGINYEQYLRMFFLLENSQDKYYRTMSAMEIRMIELGNINFRMKNYIYEVKTKYKYRIKTLNHFYEENAEYNYG